MCRITFIFLILVVMLSGCASETATRVPIQPTLTPSIQAIPTQAIPTLSARATAAPTRDSASGAPATATPTVVAVQVAATFVPGRFPPVQWSEAQRGLTAGATFEPCPPQMGNQITYAVVLADANGQPISDAVVEVMVTGGMAGMMGEHDENFTAKLPSQGAGVYKDRASLGPTNLTLFGINISVKRGNQSWAFVLPDTLVSRC